MVKRNLRDLAAAEQAARTAVTDAVADYLRVTHAVLFGAASWEAARAVRGVLIERLATHEQLVRDYRDARAEE